ncbi:hypothetical protein F4861DRAFT_131306 [Xylaria intraflava]|nr:hypothetical protein F4861DRAFT_131306 [Xylaria intraflava]
MADNEIHELGRQVNILFWLGLASLGLDHLSNGAYYQGNKLHRDGHFYYGCWCFVFFWLITLSIWTKIHFACFFGLGCGGHDGKDGDLDAWDAPISFLTHPHIASCKFAMPSRRWMWTANDGKARQVCG